MERVKDYKKFAKFNYKNGKDAHLNPFKCGDVVVDVDEPMDQSIGVIIQIHDGDELRTDMFGAGSAQFLKAASYEDISRFRPELLPELANYDITGYIIGVEGDESVGLEEIEMEVPHKLSFESYADFLEFEDKILKAYSYVYDEAMLYFESFEYRKEVNDYYNNYLCRKSKREFNVGDVVSYYIIEDVDIQPDKYVGVIDNINDYHVYTDLGHTIGVDFVHPAIIPDVKEFRPDLIKNKEQ